MYTILDESGKVLFAKFDDHVLDGQVAINNAYEEAIPEGHELYYNFKTETFYTQANDTSNSLDA